MNTVGLTIHSFNQDLVIAMIGNLKDSLSGISDSTTDCEEEYHCFLIGDERRINMFDVVDSSCALLCFELRFLCMGVQEVREWLNESLPKC